MRRLSAPPTKHDGMRWLHKSWWCRQRQNAFVHGLLAIAVYRQHPFFHGLLAFACLPEFNGCGGNCGALVTALHNFTPSLSCSHLVCVSYQGGTIACDGEMGSITASQTMNLPVAKIQHGTRRCWAWT